MTFATVRKLAAGLPGVEEGTMYGAQALKLGGRFLACMATNKAAEPGTLVVAVGFDQRDALIEEQPEVYYLKDHYLDYPCVLVRLARIDREALGGLLREARQFVETQVKTKARRKRTRPGRRSASAARYGSRRSGRPE